MNSHRQAKNEQLTRLASEVITGVIVELGAYRGEGTAALCRGASVPVYTIDDYRPKQGWAGEHYGYTDYKRFMDNVGTAATLIIENISLVKWPAKNISLLIWDLGLPDRLTNDFDTWQDRVTGKFVIHDTEDQKLGSRELNPPGWRKYKDGVFWILERKQ